MQNLIENYNLKKHLAQNPHHRTGTVTIECFRILFTIFPCFFGTGYALYKFSISLAIFLEKSIHQGEAVFFASMLISILAMLLTKTVLKNFAPFYHFKQFHELSICQMYQILRKMKDPQYLTTKEIESIKNIANISLEKEFPKNELTDLGLSCHFKIYNYLKVVKKEMKKQHYNFQIDKNALITFTENLLKSKEKN